MNDEEKQAVETFKHWIEYEKNNKEKINKADELISMQECILGIIEKQQKKIEELEKEKRILIETYTDVVYECGKRNKEIADLKMQNNIIRDMNLTVRLSEEVFDETYIRKDKIKEKIKEVESHIWKDGYMTKFDKYAIHYLKELLGE